MKVAVLMTCHNRREKTLQCLESVAAQTRPADLVLETWLVDDGSTDGTADAVRAQFPGVNLISGDGSLFWCPGMKLAWSHAASSHPDVYLWLNDDVVLERDALASLWKVASEHPDSIVVGSCACPTSGRRTYGGLRRAGHHPGKVMPLDPGERARPCDTFEGNIVWIPHRVYQRVGALGPYQHAMGDIDYGYRVAQAGLESWIAPGFQGRCALNRKDGTWEDPRLPVAARLKKLTAKKALPAADWWKFCRQHGGATAPLYFIGPYLRIARGA
jgi:GT2 family glycosyltransferase